MIDAVIVARGQRNRTECQLGVTARASRSHVAQSDSQHGFMFW
jgi:hypothetical protein